MGKQRRWKDVRRYTSQEGGGDKQKTQTVLASSERRIVYEFRWGGGITRNCCRRSVTQLFAFGRIGRPRSEGKNNIKMDFNPLALEMEFK